MANPNLRERGRASKRLALIERVLDAASALFEQKGYDGTKISEICAQANIAYGTFFNHFEGKRDLLRGLSERALRSLTEQLEQPSKEGDRSRASSPSSSRRASRTSTPRAAICWVRSGP